MIVKLTECQKTSYFFLLVCPAHSSANEMIFFVRPENRISYSITIKKFKAFGFDLVVN